MSYSQAFGTSITLFERFHTIADGFGHAQVAAAALNLLIHNVLKDHRDPQAAGQAWDRLMNDARDHLTASYDVAGRKKTYSYYNAAGREE